MSVSVGEDADLYAHAVIDGVVALNAVYCKDQERQRCRESEDDAYKLDDSDISK